MPRLIHANPTLPRSLEALMQGNLYAAATSSYTNATHFAAAACDNTGALLIADGPLQPVCSLGSINWPQLGYTVTIDSQGKVTATPHSSAYTEGTSYYRFNDSSSSSKNWLLGFSVDSYDYHPRIQRTPTIPANLVAALPANSPRASKMPLLGGYAGHAEYFEATTWNDANYRLKARRHQHPGILLSFPLIGVSKVRLFIGYEITLNGSSMHPDGYLEAPIQACFAAIKGPERLFHWPDTLELDTTLGDGYGSGIKPTASLNLTTPLTSLVDKAYHTATWDLDIPPSGLGIFWVELEPFAYSTFAQEAMRLKNNAAFWQSLYFRAQIQNAIALP